MPQFGKLYLPTSTKVSASSFYIAKTWAETDNNVTLNRSNGVVLRTKSKFDNYAKSRQR